METQLSIGKNYDLVYKNCTEDELAMDEALSRMYGKDETSQCAQDCYSYYNRHAFGPKVVYRTTRRSSFAKHFVEAMTVISDFGEFLGSPFSLVRTWCYGSFHCFYRSPCLTRKKVMPDL